MRLASADRHSIAKWLWGSLDCRSDRHERSDRSDRPGEARWSKSSQFSKQPHHSQGHGKHGASAPSHDHPHWHGHGEAQADHEARHSAKHDDRRTAAHGLRDHKNIAHGDRVQLSSQSALAPASAVSASATASAPDDSAPDPQPSLSDDVPAPQPTTAPASSGAGATGISLLQLAGDDIAGSAQLDSILLGVAVHADDNLPSGPTAKTDSSPD